MAVDVGTQAGLAAVLTCWGLEGVAWRLHSRRRYYREAWQGAKAVLVLQPLRSSRMTRRRLEYRSVVMDLSTESGLGGFLPRWSLGGLGAGFASGGWLGRRLSEVTGEDLADLGVPRAVRGEVLAALRAAVTIRNSPSW
jgi:hypothetical protein